MLVKNVALLYMILSLSLSLSRSLSMHFAREDLPPLPLVPAPNCGQVWKQGVAVALRSYLPGKSVDLRLA
jgi:hypothetical protein